MTCLPLLVLSLLPTIWVVDSANGPGTSFTDLPAAVAAAQSGDTILVRAGAYSHFVVSGKALTIRGDGWSVAVVGGPPPPGSAYPTTTIAGVPPGSTFHVGGLRFTAGYTVSSTVYPGLRIAGGRVSLTDSWVEGVSCCLLSGTPGLYVEGAAEVHAAGCSFQGTAGYSGQGGHGAVVLNGSSLSAYNCGFIGGGAGGGFLPYSGAGIYGDGGFLSLSYCQAIGGNATLVGWGGTGIVVLNGFARISGTVTTNVKGGTGAGGGPNGYSIFTDANATAIVHGPVSLIGPLSGSVTTGAPVLPVFSVTGTLAAGGELQAGAPVTASIQGAIPSAPFAFILDFDPTYSMAYAPVALGEQLVSFPSAVIVEGMSNASGNATFYFTPAVHLPGFLNTPLYVQVGVLDGVAGQIRLSNGWIGVFRN